jgi:ribonuclease HI
MPEYSLFFDGAFKNKTASFGFVLYLDGQEIDYGYGIIGQGRHLTSTVAEYYGLSYGLDAFIRKVNKPNAVLNICGDSKFVIDRIQKQVHEFQELQFISLKLKQIRRTIKVNIALIPRTKNQVANDLAKKLRS